MKIKKVNPLQWLVEPLESDESFAQKKMFGADVVYIGGRQVLAMITGDEPWNGLLVCTSREHHESLIQEYPELSSHAVLGKWLYISQSNKNFEQTAERLTKQILEGDVRIGIEPKAKARKQKQK